MAVLFLVAMSLPGPLRARADTDELSVILLHPGVPTTIRLPDAVKQTRILDRGEHRLAYVRDTVVVRPRPGTRAGTRAVLEVESRTVLRRFPVRVVRHAREAHRKLQVGPTGRLDHLHAPPAFPRVGLLRPPVLFQEPPAPATAPPVSVLALAPGPAAPASPEPAASPSSSSSRDEHDTTPAIARRFDLSVHALGALGSTAFQLPGYQSIYARQSHGVFGLRITAHPQHTWWSVETTISGEFPLTPTRHTPGSGVGIPTVEVDGPRLRADVGVKGRFGRRLMQTVSASIGLQAHYLDIRTPAGLPNDRLETDLPLEGGMALGVGLEYRAGDMLFGVELHVRQGMPPGYHSVGVLLSVGRYLDRGGP